VARTLKVVQGDEPKPKNASEALHTTRDEYLHCRDLRHPWSVVGLFYVGKEVHRKLVCERCGTEATDRWSPKGARIARQYKYAEGYQAHVGIRIKPIDVRREVLQRVEVYATEQDMMNSLFRGGRRKRA
jgi:hypothetical protein